MQTVPAADTEHGALIVERPRLASVAATAARLALAVVWTWAALAKIADPDAAVRAVRAFELFPEAMVKPVAWGLPFVELALAALFVVGLSSRAAAWASAALFVLFIGMIGSAWARGLSIDCGCFGGGGEVASGVDASAYAVEIARDALFLGVACFVALGPRSHLSVDRRLGL